VKLDFYNSNRARAYPFIYPSDLPDSAIVDFGCWFLRARTDTATVPAVTLAAIRLVNDSVEFVFKCADTTFSDRILLFHLDRSAGLYTTQFVSDQAGIDDQLANAEAEDLRESIDTTQCLNDPLWEGYLVVGNLAALCTWLEANYPVGGMYLFNTPQTVEPSVVHNQARQLRRVGLANKERTRVSAPAGCRAPCWDFVQEDAYTVAGCLDGELTFVDGYNNTVTQITATNSLVFNVATNTGKGFPTEELKVTADEAPPLGASTLSGSLLCCETVRSIAGVPGPIVLFREGAGVRITTYPALHRIIVDFDFHDLAACPELPEPEDVECIAPSEDLCECGPLDMSEFECPEPVNPTTEPPTTEDTTEGSTGVESSGDWIILICNSNNVTDDVLEIRLNNHVLGIIDQRVIGDGICKGIILTTNAGVPATIANDAALFESADVCRCNAVPVVLFSPDLLVTGTNTIQLRCIVNNGQSNFGRLIVAKVVPHINVVFTIERIELNTYYIQPSGMDFNATFEHIW